MLELLVQIRAKIGETKTKLWWLGCFFCLFFYCLISTGKPSTVLARLLKLHPRKPQRKCGNFDNIPPWNATARPILGVYSLPNKTNVLLKSSDLSFFFPFSNVVSKTIVFVTSRTLNYFTSVCNAFTRLLRIKQITFFYQQICELRLLSLLSTLAIFIEVLIKKYLLLSGMNDH